MSRYLLAVFVVIFLSLFVFGCSQTPAIPSVSAETLEPTTTPSLFPTSKPYSTQIITPIVPSPTIELNVERSKIKSLMEKYGSVDDYYLTDAYWKRITDGVAKFGPAKRILTLEYHGNDYWMYDGAYSMTPETFDKQIEYLMENEYHFVTVHELRGYLEGWLKLPARSIILTSDSGYTSQKSFPLITESFSKFEMKYGYKPHLISFIWTMSMTEVESDSCKDNKCWKTFETALNSHFFTFGTHSESHTDFGKKDVGFTKDDLKGSLSEIKTNLGLSVYAITWPYEECSPHLKTVTDLGIVIGFGGWSRPMAKNYTYFMDDQQLCLPRLFPPNPDGGSGRPQGKTWKEMLVDAREKE